jgi:hypothetical protein
MEDHRWAWLKRRERVFIPHSELGNRHSAIEKSLEKKPGKIIMEAAFAPIL